MVLFMERHRPASHRAPAAHGLTARIIFAWSGSKLASITDPIGNVTTINTTTGGGLPLTVTDANGVLTTLAYNTRNWLTSSVLTVAGGSLTTSVNYDNAGNLTKTTLPDSSYLSYGYNNAHRLTSVTNALSETKNLTLDAMGNVTQSIWKNTGGVTKWQRNATYDALGRMLTDMDGVSHNAFHMGFAGQRADHHRPPEPCQHSGL